MLVFIMYTLQDRVVSFHKPTSNRVAGGVDGTG